MGENQQQHVCLKCGGLLRQKVKVVVDCPGGQRSLDKAEIRKAGIIIEAVLWDYPTIYCESCGFTYRYQMPCNLGVSDE